MNVKNMIGTVSLSATIIGAIYLGVKISDIDKYNSERIKETVRIYNPQKYYEIINSPNSNDREIWRKALEEVRDSLRNLNDNNAKNRFKADQLIQKSKKLIK